MAQTETDSSAMENSAARELAPLKGMCFGAIVMILIQYGLGMWVNLFGHLPTSDHGRGFFDAFGRAIADGPAGLGIHAVFGVMLGLAAIQSLVRGIQSRRRVLMWMSVIGFAAVVVAGLSGIFFVSDQHNGNSFAMAISAGVGLLAYAIALMSLSFA
ncbi:MAG: hypothetical protein WB770_06230 [Acidimicrobiales bacterium]